MGGDNAPQVVVEGAVMAAQELDGKAQIVLYGVKSEIEKYLPTKTTAIEVVDCSEVIEMGDHPAEAFKQKQNSSIVRGFMDLAMGKIAGFSSAGSTGAMMVGSMFVIKAIEGVIRPTIASPYVGKMGTPITLLDVGLNSDCKPEVLEQYAVMGGIYSKYYCGVENPRVALLNIGSEEGKGNLLTKATFDLLKNKPGVNFVGNIEGKDIVMGKKMDVIVCDGFIGNIVLKLMESLYPILSSEGVKGIQYIDSMNYESVGGTPVLGINSTVIIGHGASSPLAIKNMVKATARAVESKLVEKIKEAFSE